LPSYIGEINYAVDGYRFAYLTPNEDGDSVLASGAIFLPVDPVCPSPILSWQHGTMVADAGAPSKTVENQALGAVSASHGYIVIMSDYLGLGSGDGFHNYCHAETESSAIIDCIIQGKIFASSQGVDPNNQLFLMGYSQGGHSTMATVKEIEENWNNLLNITASCPMAGPYSMSEAQAEMINTVYPNPGYFPYLIFAYKNVYENLYDTISDVLKPGYSDLYEMYSSGLYSMGEINDTIRFIAEEMYGISEESFTPLDMIQEDYYVAYQNDPNHPFQVALEDNDLLDFIPNSPMRIIHCNGDNDVAYENSVMAFEAFEAEATEELVLLDGGNFSHSECVLMSLISAKLFFDTKANFCGEVFMPESNKDKEVVAIFDSFGRFIKNPNECHFMIKLYSDGSVEKIILKF